MLWNHWWILVCQLRSACARTRTFLWMALCLAGMTVRTELLGVTSIVRALGLEPACYDRLLDFFHSPALDWNKLTRAWLALVFRIHPGILRVNGRVVLVGDGLKVAKAGRKTSALARIDPGLLAKNDPPGCCRHGWRRCSSRLRDDRLAGFGARQGVREGTPGRCQLLFRPS